MEALQTYSKNWLPLLFTAFINAKSGHRAPLANTIAAYAAISEQSLLTGLFHTTLKKFLKVRLSSLPFSLLSVTIISASQPPATGRPMPSCNLRIANGIALAWLDALVLCAEASRMC